MQWFKKSQIEDMITREPLTFPTYPFVMQTSPTAPWTQQVTEPWGGGFNITVFDDEPKHDIRVEKNREDLLNQPFYQPSPTVITPWTGQSKPDYLMNEPESFVHSENPVQVYRTRGGSKSSINCYNNRSNMIRYAQTAQEIANKFILLRKDTDPNKVKISYRKEEIIAYIIKLTGKKPDDDFVNVVIEAIRKRMPAINFIGADMELKWFYVTAADNPEITPQLQDVIHRVINEVSSRIPDIDKVEILEFVRAYKFEPKIEDLVFEEIMKFFEDKSIEIPQKIGDEKEQQAPQREEPKEEKETTEHEESKETTEE